VAPDPALVGAVRAGGVPVVGLYAVDERGYVAVLVDRPDDTTVGLIGSLHAALRRDGIASDGVWAVREDLASPMGLGRRWWAVGPDDDRPRPDGSVNTAVRRWVLRERSTALLGPPASAVVSPVDQATLAAEALGVARSRGEAVDDRPALLDDPDARAALVDELAVAWHAAATGGVVDAAPARRWCGDQGVRADPGAAPPDVRRFVWEVHARVGMVVTEGRAPGGLGGLS